MQPDGYFDWGMYHTPGKVGDEIHRLRELGRGAEALQLLKTCELEVGNRQHNQIFNNMAGWLPYRILGAPRINEEVQAAWEYFTTIWLRTTSSIPVWTEYGDSGYYRQYRGADVTLPDVLGDVTGERTAYKTFNEDIETRTITSESMGSGLRAIYRTWKFLWTNQEANGSGAALRSIGIGAYENENTWANANTEGWFRGSVRVRLKDSGGVPVTLTKDSSKTFLIEYQMRLMSL